MNTLFSQIHIPGKPFFGAANDFIFLRQPNGRYAVGKGPFTLVAQPSSDTATFYFNDFTHRFSRSWIRPCRFYETADLAELVRLETSKHSSPRIAWQSPSREEFQRAFDAVTHYLDNGVVNKLVPVVVEEGHIISGRPATMIRALESMPLPFYPYGIRIGDAGMIGASPEPILSIEGDRLSTVALAGTAPSDSGNQLLHRDKEGREHAYVADFIASRLSAFGKTRRSSRGRLVLGSVTHLITAFETRLSSKPKLEQMLGALHPTPAVGPWPRTPRTLQLALALRNMAGVPRAFAAPFGVAHGGDFHALLTIRNVIWKGSRIMLSAGCGIVRGSDIDEEWEELRLKRDSVKTFLRLDHALVKTRDNDCGAASR